MRAAPAPVGTAARVSQSGAAPSRCRVLRGGRRTWAARRAPERPMLDALKVLFVLTGASTYLVRFSPESLGGRESGFAVRKARVEGFGPFGVVRTAPDKPVLCIVDFGPSVCRFGCPAEPAPQDGGVVDMDSWREVFWPASWSAATPPRGNGRSAEARFRGSLGEDGEIPG
ncbi:hypothetical protein HPB47_023366 [Ixodes persulcatus]|uniref:Uncharacterized protein n=1 Tax=Ixodes persulcatus TaxID=34615 RepID=A0AC60Q9G5_IXOPE|nr:hypothetical protein HPB47_023366 [Ixodes persulcatus]